MNRLIVILYEIALGLLALIAFPKMLYQLLVYKKYRTNLLTRFGVRYPEIKKGSHPLIWIHAVSVGETKAVASLARLLKREYPEAQLVISSITETGHAEAQRSLPFANYHVYLPFDFSFLIRRLISKAVPDVVICCESDFWFNFLRYTKKHGARVALVNGKVSQRSALRFQRFSFFSKHLFNLFDVLHVQNDLYKKRFIQIGVSAERIHATGNLKFDDEYPQLSQEEVIQWRKRLGVGANQLVLTIGSTHNPEENLFLQILKDIWKQYPSLKVILVPRHPERFKEVASLLERQEIPFVSFTDIHRRTEEEQVILIDAMGMLRMCYQLSDIALVGGSYTSKVGGHNILEPCWYGKPVLFGPHMHTQVEIVDLVKQYQAGYQVSQQELAEILQRWMQKADERACIGQQGLNLMRDLKGSTQRTLEGLRPLLTKLSDRSF